MSLAIPISPRHRRRLAVLRSPVLARRNRPRLEWLEDRIVLSTFLVTNTGDSGPGSLRQVIVDSNATTGTTNTIDFDIPGFGVQTIAPLSSLPTITNPVLIDGESQPGYSGTPLIELSGTQAGSGDGFLITSPNVTIRGMDMGGFASAPASTSRVPAIQAIGSTATFSAPIRPARRPSRITKESRSMRARAET